jgi:rhomboid protease GluP
MDSLLSILYVLGLYGAYLAGSLHLRAQSPQPASRPRLATLALLLVVGIPSVLQFFYPAMLPALQRDYPRFLQGEWWRLITPLFVQDGGIAGASFNLVSLLLVGMVAEQMWGSPLTLVLFFAGGVVGEIAGFAWQPLGAGNSVANFALAGSIVVACLAQRPAKAVWLAGLLALGAYILLFALHDIHGAAAVAGVLLALAMTRFNALPQRKDRPA